MESRLFKLLTTIALFLSFNLYAHHSSNCDALKDYDFSKFEEWKGEVISKSSEYNLDSNFVSNLIEPYSVNKSVIGNDKCQPEFTLTFSEYLEKRISDLRIKNGINKKTKYNDLLKKIENKYNVQSRLDIIQ